MTDKKELCRIWRAVEINGKIVKQFKIKYFYPHHTSNTGWINA